MPPTWAPTVQGLWARVTGGDVPLDLGTLPGPRAYAVTVDGGRVRVAASDAVSACVGIHAYLREAHGIRVSWDSDLPLRLPAPGELAPIEGRARVAEFYYLNFCTFGYTTAYWDWADWEREIDWMALHGVTMPLSLVGHEAVLARAFGRLGMSEAETRDFLGGPGYLPWLYMGCLDSFAGPLPAGWIGLHLDLGRRVLERQRAFGMTPVLPAFTGHVPRRLAPPGARTRRWQGLETAVVGPDDPLFRRLATEVVTAQRDLLGTDHLYAADPFIEMIPADTDGDAGYPAAVATAIVDGLRAADPFATWVLQSWPFSYQSDYWTRERIAAFLDRVPRDAVLLLDLWGEADPQWERLDGFAGRPWIWNGLLNFGGRTDPVADLAATDRRLEAALAAPRPPLGLGLTMEAIHNNPAFFALVADRAWQAAPAGVEAWIQRYGRERHGTADAATDRAWQALRRSVLDGDARSIFPERFISVAVTRPDYTRALDLDSEIRAALFYRPEDLLDACAALLEAPPSRPAGNDLALATTALLLRVIDHRYLDVVAAARAGRRDPAAAEAFLAAFDDLDALVATRPELRLETWVGAARRWGGTAEDNARRVLTTWNTADNPALDDYAARIWSGLVGGYHKRRWELWLRHLPLEPGGRAAAQAALDADLRELVERFIAEGPAVAASGDRDVRTASREVLGRYGAEFRALR
jgi:alpha-N-acetylglucosaminidase